MLIKFAQNTVTPYNFTKNYEPVFCEIEKTLEKIVDLKIFPENKDTVRGNIYEFPNKITLSEDSENSVKAANLLSAYFLTLDFAKADFMIKEDTVWTDSEITYPFRVSISKDSVIENYSQFIEEEKAKGYPVYYKSDYIVLYVPQILEAHREILEADINAIIEEY